MSKRMILEAKRRIAESRRLVGESRKIPCCKFEGIDTLSISKRLASKGFGKEQSEEMASVIEDNIKMLSCRFISVLDLEKFELRIKRDAYSEMNQLLALRDETIKGVKSDLGVAQTSWYKYTATGILAFCFALKYYGDTHYPPPLAPVVVSGTGGGAQEVQVPVQTPDPAPAPVVVSGTGGGAQEVQVQVPVPPKA